MFCLDNSEFSYDQTWNATLVTRAEISVSFLFLNTLTTRCIGSPYHLHATNRLVSNWTMSIPRHFCVLYATWTSLIWWCSGEKSVEWHHLSILGRSTTSRPVTDECPVLNGPGGLRLSGLLPGSASWWAEPCATDCLWLSSFLVFSATWIRHFLYIASTAVIHEWDSITWVLHQSSLFHLFDY